jgi:biopolymer transport protein ExbB
MRRSPANCASGTSRIWLATGFAVVVIAFLAGADGPGTEADDAGPASPNLDAVLRRTERLAHRAEAWYRTTPAGERVTWGGLAACIVLGTCVLLERSIRLRRERIVPTEFRTKLLDRLTEGKLDRGKGLDYCELNQSPVARVALAAVRRWGRPAADMERAVAMAKQVETDRLRRNLGTLRRIAVLGPLLGLLGSLMAAGRGLSALGATAAADAWGPTLAAALAPLTAGVALAILALVVYDGFVGRVETFSVALDRAGLETIDAIASACSEPRRSAVAGPHWAARAELTEASSQDDR